jgi:Ornithine carbamoyltransferase
MKNFINIGDINKQDLRKIIEHAKSQKKKRFNINKSAIDPEKSLIDKTLIMLFQKASTRTKLSFELAMKQLGGQLLVLDPKESHYGSGDESIYDTAKVLSQYGDIVMMRTHKHKHLLEFSKHLDIPIINGLTNLSHPCQIMSDIMTFEELKGSITKKKIAWLGDGNNVVYSLIEAAVKFN